MAELVGAKQLIPERKRQIALALYGIPECIKFGDFTLASGQKSPYYLDLRLLISRTTEQRLLADAYAEILEAVEMDRLVGIPEAALDMAALVGDRLGMPRIGIRKQAKDHGIGKRLYGIREPGMRVVMLEDVMTTGGSMIDVANYMKEEGELNVFGGVVAVDREQGGPANMAAAGYGSTSLLTVSNIIEVLKEDGLLAVDFFEIVTDYLAEQRAKLDQGIA